MSEEWRPVIGWEGVYEVSDAGNVKRVGGGVRGAVVGRILKPSFGLGYKQLRLANRAEVRTVRIHEMVAAAFIGPRPPGYVINHIDGNKVNNDPSNLEYITRGENAVHAWRIGMHDHNRKQVCLHGHALTPENRYKHGACKVCCKRRAKEQKTKRRIERALRKAA